MAEKDIDNSQKPAILIQIKKEADYLKANSYNPYYTEVGSGLKSLIKRVIRKVNKFLIFPMSERQNNFNLHTANGIDAARIIGESHQNQIDYLKEKIDNVLSSLYTSNVKTNNSIDLQNKKIDEQRLRLEEQNRAIDEQRLAIKKINHEIDDLVMTVSREINNRILYNDHRIEDSENLPIENCISRDSVIEKTDDENKNTYAMPDYFKFQNDFRGTQADIMERQRIYVPYFKDKKGIILDFGCGRGEFLRLMKEANIPAIGIDTYPEYEITGKLYDVEILVGDGLGYLEKSTEPFGGIFCAQVIEHLGFSNIEKLCSLAFNKLEDGGCLILETPNPMCLSMFTNAFYIDPSHDKPVHPLLMEYLLKSLGFVDIKLLWPNHSLEQLPHIQSNSISNIGEVNRSIDRVSHILFGSQDYAVVARKPGIAEK